MSRFRDFLKPHHKPSRAGRDFIIAGWLFLALLTWVAWPSDIMPRPGDVATAWWDLIVKGGLIGALVQSYSTNLVALGWTVAIALPLSYATVIPAVQPIGALATKLRFLGMTGLPIMLTVLLKSGYAVKVSMLTFSMVVFFVTSMSEAVLSIPKEKLDHARTLGMSEWEVFWQVVVLGTRDQAIEVLRQQAAVGFMMLTMVEGISRSEGGVGVLLLDQNKYLHLSAVIAIQATILGVGLAQDFAIGWLRDVVCPYAALKVER